MSDFVKQRIDELRETTSAYKTGSTFRFARQRPTNPPTHLRVGLFGPPGVGKSALINSMNYATGKRWENVAPEGFATEASKTLARNAYDVAEYITVIDNRGMISLGGPFMVELGHQVAGVYGEGEEVEWNAGFFRQITAGLTRAWSAKAECAIHCAVLVLSALSLGMRPQDLKDLIDTIKTMTGQPPIVVITHCRSESACSDALSAFRTGLQEMRIDYVFEVENYTTDNHTYDIDKHLVLLEALHQCCIVGDRVMKYKEEEGSSCTIL